MSSVEELENLAALVERGIDKLELGEAQTFSLVGTEGAETGFAAIVAQNVLSDRCLPADVRLRPDGRGIDVVPWLG